MVCVEPGRVKEDDLLHQGQSARLEQHIFLRDTDVGGEQAGGASL